MAEMQADTPYGKVYDARLVRRLWEYVAPHTRLVVGSLVCLAAMSAAQLGQPLLVRWGVDAGIAEGNLGILARAALGFLLLLGVEFGTRYGQLLLMNLTGQRVIYYLRVDVFRRLQHLPAAFFDRNPTGRLMTRATNDIEALEEMFASGVVAVVGDVVKLGAIMGIMLWLNWRLALVAFAVIPVLLACSILFRLRIRNAYRGVRRHLARINGYLQENILGMLVVKLFGREARNLEEFQAINREHLEAEQESVLYDSAFSAVVEYLGVFATAAIIWYGGHETLRGALTFGTLFAFLDYAAKFFLPIQDLSAKFAVMQSAMAASERIFALLGEVPEADPAHLSPVPGGGSVTFRNVWFRYREGTGPMAEDDWVLRDVSFAVRAGERVALVGATGAGKTTIIKLINRLYPVTRGSVRLDDRDLREYPLPVLRRAVGMVLQDVYLFAGPLGENIALEPVTPEIELRLHRVMRELNLDGFLARFPDRLAHPVAERGENLSAGERQLIALARAFYYDPILLILDEATSSVDQETETMIQAAIERTVRHRTTMIVAHRLATVRSADRILVLHRGQLREEGSHQELMAHRGLYYKLVQLQFQRPEGGAAGELARSR